MLPRDVPLLNEEQWKYLEAAMKRGPTPEMKARLERAKKVYEANPL